MINFRYHVVSIIGIFIALAVGVVLGAGRFSGRLTLESIRRRRRCPRTRSWLLRPTPKPLV